MAASRCETVILNSLAKRTIVPSLKRPHIDPKQVRNLCFATKCYNQQSSGQERVHLPQHSRQPQPRLIPTAVNNKSAIRFTSTSSPQKTVAAQSLQGATQEVRSRRDVSTQAQQQVETLINEQEAIKYSSSFRCSEMRVIKCSRNEMQQKPSPDQLVFGQAFTDHMFRVDWTSETGWSTPLISKLHSLDIHPAAKVLHYSIQAFEGAKVYRGHDDKIRFFRLDQNVKRLQRSALRLELPSFDANELVKCIHNLVNIEQEWIPKSQNHQQFTSLYVRPTILGVDPSLGVANSRKAVLYVLLSPVGPYFKTGFKPVSLYADPGYVRAWPGGAGDTKIGSNYGPTIMIQKEAEKLGLQQVLWLFGNDMKLTEIGTMNVFVSIRNSKTGKIHLVTPPLKDGLILPGITRASIIDLARLWPDVVVEERYITIGELQQLQAENRLLEMFGAGTACIVCPISLIQLKNGTKIRIPHSNITQPVPEGTEIEDVALTRRILKSITDIQYGKVSHPWAQELFDF